MHYVLVAIICGVVGMALGYALRGKEHAAIAAADAKAKGVLGDVGRKL
jgi:hypothetical protein